MSTELVKVIRRLKKITASGLALLIFSHRPVRSRYRLADVDVYVQSLQRADKQDSYGRLRQEDIALASLAETRKAESRARILRRLHKESI